MINLEQKKPWHRLMPLLSETEVVSRIAEMATSSTQKHREDYPIYIRVNNGAAYFADEFEKGLRENDAHFETGSIRVRSMNGSDQGELEVVDKYKGPDITGRKIVILEDIVDSGTTIEFLLKHFSAMAPALIEVIALYSKPDDRKIDVPLEDVGFDVFGFVVGSNLDYDQLYRELKGLQLVRFFPKTIKHIYDFFRPKMPIRKTSPSTI